MSNWVSFLLSILPITENHFASGSLLNHSHRLSLSAEKPVTDVSWVQSIHVPETEKRYLLPLSRRKGVLFRQRLASILAISVSGSAT